MLSVRLNTSTGTLSGIKSRRRFRKVTNTSPEPGGMTTIPFGCSALSKMSSQRR